MTLTAPPPPRTAPAHAYRTRRLKAHTSLHAHGEPMVWLTGGALAVSLAMITGLLLLVLLRGAGTFWPTPIVRVKLVDGQTLMGEVTRRERFSPSSAVINALPPDAAASARAALEASGGEAYRRLIRTGNFELTNSHFHWVSDFEVAEEDRPAWALAIERTAWGRFYGEPRSFLMDGRSVADGPEAAWAEFKKHHGAIQRRVAQRRELETDDVGQINGRIEAARLATRDAEARHGKESPEYRLAAETADRVARQGEEDFAALRARIEEFNQENARFQMVLATAAGQDKALPLADVVRAYPANQLTFGGRLGVYASRWWEFLSEEPREANSEGGVFPAIFGTLLMTMVMSLLVVPFGVLAALYLREYAKAGPIVSAVRIAVNNLAGVPSIVFGVFGLGFFVYGLGSYIDSGPAHPMSRGAWLLLAGFLILATLGAVAIGLLHGRTKAWPPRVRSVLRGTAMALWGGALVALVVLIATNPYFQGFFGARLPNPTFGKGGLIWASLTLALLTLPVVIVATEEALAAVPGSMREGSYACGAGKWQTIRRIVLPRALPGIMTGLILAMARGAGEVAPLMLVGAVKLAPELPGEINATAPFVHVERSFMHLGFHIYDVGFQSANSEAAKPMVFTTTLLLIVLVAGLNVAAVWVRGRLRRRFAGNQF